MLHLANQLDGRGQLSVVNWRLGFVDLVFYSAININLCWGVYWNCFTHKTLLWGIFSLVKLYFFVSQFKWNSFKNFFSFRFPSSTFPQAKKNQNRVFTNAAIKTGARIRGESLCRGGRTKNSSATTQPNGNTGKYDNWYLKL